MREKDDIFARFRDGHLTLLLSLNHQGVIWGITLRNFGFKVFRRVYRVICDCNRWCSIKFRAIDLIARSVAIQFGGQKDKEFDNELLLN